MGMSALAQWDLKLRQALDAVDVELERRFGEALRRQPSRPPNGVAASPKYDGVFSITASFSMGYTTGNIPGYTIELRIVSASPVDAGTRELILDEASALLPEAIAQAFPGRKLSLERRGDRFFLSGDLGLG